MSVEMPIIEMREIYAKKTPQKFKNVKVGDILLFSEKSGKRYFRTVKNIYKQDKKRFIVLSEKEHIGNIQFGLMKFLIAVYSKIMN
jgi:hypothetical protein